MIEIDILSLFPDYLKSPFQESILKRAQARSLLSLRHVDLRSFGEGVHRKVDDRAYGGGPGMVLMAGPLSNALESVRKPDSHVIHLSPQGRPLTQARCSELAQKSHLILLAGHYEGIDERFIESEVDEEISIGDFVLTNGALAAIVLVDAVVRLIPGVLGDQDSSRQDSFSSGLLDCPHYTRPDLFDGKRVPEVLLSGNHSEIQEWRERAALERTRQRRPDLYHAYLAKNGRPSIKKKFEPQPFNLVIGCRALKRMSKFYSKMVGLHLDWEDGERAEFKEGIILAKGEKKAYPSLLIYPLRDKNLFESILSRLIRGGYLVGALREVGEGLEASFVDEEDNPWVLRYLERD